MKKELSKDYVLVPVSWLEKLVELAENEGTNVQHIKGYISSSEVLIDSANKITVDQMDAIMMRISNCKRKNARGLT